MRGESERTRFHTSEVSGRLKEKSRDLYGPGLLLRIPSCLSWDSDVCSRSNGGTRVSLSLDRFWGSIQYVRLQLPDALTRPGTSDQVVDPVSDALGPRDGPARAETLDRKADDQPLRLGLP